MGSSSELKLNLPPPEWPPWFYVGKNTSPRHVRNVCRGWHPIGIPLLTPNTDGRKCKHCAHLHVNGHTRNYFKCGRTTWTNGSATDIRLKWAACTMFYEENDGKESTEDSG